MSVRVICETTDLGDHLFSLLEFINEFGPKDNVAGVIASIQSHCRNHNIKPPEGITEEFVQKLVDMGVITFTEYEYHD